MSGRRSAEIRPAFYRNGWLSFQEKAASRMREVARGELRGARSAELPEEAHRGCKSYRGCDLHTEASRIEKVV